MEQLLKPEHIEDEISLSQEEPLSQTDSLLEFWQETPPLSGTPSSCGIPSSLPDESDFSQHFVKEENSCKRRKIKNQSSFEHTEEEKRMIRSLFCRRQGSNLPFKDDAFFTDSPESIQAAIIRYCKANSLLPPNFNQNQFLAPALAKFINECLDGDQNADAITENKYRLTKLSGFSMNPERTFDARSKQFKAFSNIAFRHGQEQEATSVPPSHRGDAAMAGVDVLRKENQELRQRLAVMGKQWEQLKQSNEELTVAYQLAILHQDELQDSQEQIEKRSVQQKRQENEMSSDNQQYMQSCNVIDKFLTAKEMSTVCSGNDKTPKRIFQSACHSVFWCLLASDGGFRHFFNKKFPLHTDEDFADFMGHLKAMNSIHKVEEAKKKFTELLEELCSQNAIVAMSQSHNIHKPAPATQMQTPAAKSDCSDSSCTAPACESGAERKSTLAPARDVV